MPTLSPKEKTTPWLLVPEVMTSAGFGFTGLAVCRRGSLVAVGVAVPGAGGAVSGGAAGGCGVELGRLKATISGLVILYSVLSLRIAKLEWLRLVLG